MILLQLFWSFFQVGIFSIGGGYAAMPLIRSQVVEGYGWLTMNEFTDLITIAEMTPGPIVVNSATFVGISLAGAAGAIVATFGSILPSVLILSVLAWVCRKYKNVSAMQSVLNCLRPVVVALIASAGLSILKTALFSGQAMGPDTLSIPQLLCFLGAFFVLRKFKCNPIAVMVVCGILGLLVFVIF